MRIMFFVIAILLWIFWLHLTFYFFKLDCANVNNMVTYDNNFFEAIFFIWLFVFGMFIGRFFAFHKKEKTLVIHEENNLDNKEKNDESNGKENENLKIIEWIWPKVEQLLKLNWVNTVKQLSESGYDELKIILERAWDNFKIINPRSWSYQAELVTNKQWNKLKEYQDFLVWGIDKNEFNK